MIRQLLCINIILWSKNQVGFYLLYYISILVNNPNRTHTSPTSSDFLTYNNFDRARTDSPRAGSSSLSFSSSPAACGAFSQSGTRLPGSTAAGARNSRARRRRRLMSPTMGRRPKIYLDAGATRRFRVWQASARQLIGSARAVFDA